MIPNFLQHETCEQHMKLANSPNRSWHSYESSPSLRVPDNVIHKPSLDGQAMSKKWSGWQELNLRGHVPKTCGWPLPYTRIKGEGLAALSCLPLHADHLAQRVHHVHQIALRFHHCINGLVRHRCFVDNVRILTALDARRCLGVIVQCETTLGFCT
jgi:hypothetical protein